MKIAILADPNRKSKDKPVVDEAKEAFGEEGVIYAPITQVRFDLSKDLNNGITVRFNGFDLAEFDAVIPIPTTTHAELFYTALWMLSEQNLPFDAEKYLITMNEEMLFNFLESNGVPVRKYITVASNASLDRVEENIKYPALVRPPRKRVIVTNKRTLKDVISLYKIGTPIKIETPIKAKKNVWVFVLGDEVVASYEKFERTAKTIAIDDELKRLAIKVRRLIGCDYCSMRFLMQGNEWIIDKLTLSPDFSNFQKITGVNIARYVVSRFLEKAKKMEKPWWHTKVEEFFRVRKQRRK